MTDPGLIQISDFNYLLPEDRIAKFPLEERDRSKLLILRNGILSTDTFKNISEYIPPHSLVFFNETRVILARLIFKKESGANIEIFCLEPDDQPDIQMAFQQKGKSVWKCFIGNVRRWKGGVLKKEIQTGGINIILKASLLRRNANNFMVEFAWEPQHKTFSDIIECFGLIPIPPYLNREPIDEDKRTYQTIYARNEGSVAAPTAGLHFTDEVFESLKNKGVQTEKLTLHVGAGTFKPVVTETIKDHEMHFEKIVVPRHSLENLIKKINDPVIAVGTTSVRTLESLYWFGHKILDNPGYEGGLFVEQWEPYVKSSPNEYSVKEVLFGLLQWLDRSQKAAVVGSTRLIIVPGYKYRVVDGMVTNFHQPQSTLLLLVSGFIGERWKEVYNYALTNGFRFLSYGDACLFLR